MKVKDIMTKEVIFTEAPGNASEALELIIKKKISGMPVVKRGTKELLGIITRDDFSKHPEETQVALLMTREAVTITPEADVKEAAQLILERGFRRMPVVKNGGLVGIVTVMDLVGKALGAADVEDTVDEYLREDVTSIWENTPLKVAYEIMRLANVRALTVLDDKGKLVGILADTDLLKVSQVTESTEKSELSAATEGDRWSWDSKNVIYITKKTLELPDKVVKDIMTRDVISATKKTPVRETARKMARARVEQIPVIDAEGNIIGLVRDIDILRAL
ncbi:MAG: CBS domain-containing protein [Candidatus Hydrothermarchaeaceae archaeon]